MPSDPAPATPLRVLMIGPVPPPPGGQAAVVEGILAGAGRLGCAFRVLDVSHAHPGRLARLWTGLGFVARLLALLISDREIAVVHVHSSAGPALVEKTLLALLARCFRKPVLLHVHGGRLAQSWEGSGALGRRLIRWLLRRFDAIAVLSEAWTSFYRDALRVSTPLVVLPNVPLLPDDPPSRGPHPEIVFLYVGHLKPQKGLLELRDAFVRLRRDPALQVELRLMGAGDRPEHEQIVRRAFRGVDGVRFLGTRSGEEKWRAYAQADVFVLPSHSEDLPMTLLEAMGVGLPVVATRVGSITSLVESGRNGCLVEPRDAEALGAALDELARNAELRQRQGEAARETIRSRHASAAYLDELGTTYRRLASGK